VFLRVLIILALLTSTVIGMFVLSSLASPSPSDFESVAAGTADPGMDPLPSGCYPGGDCPTRAMYEIIGRGLGVRNKPGVE